MKPRPLQPTYPIITSLSGRLGAVAWSPWVLSAGPPPVPVAKQLQWLASTEANWCYYGTDWLLRLRASTWTTRWAQPQQTRWVVHLHLRAAQRGGQQFPLQPGATPDDWVTPYLRLTMKCWSLGCNKHEQRYSHSALQYKYKYGYKYWL